jgi:hypothetical protein
MTMVLGRAGSQNGGRGQSESKKLDSGSTDSRATAQNQDRAERAAASRIKIGQRNMQAIDDSRCGREITEPTNVNSQ